MTKMDKKDVMKWKRGFEVSWKRERRIVQLERVDCERSIFVDFAGVRISIPKVDDMVIYKLVASRVEDLRDIEELLLRYLDKIDLRRVRRIVRQVADILERQEMIDHLNDLIRRTKTRRGK
jgi:hypothetical protein